MLNAGRLGSQPPMEHSFYPQRARSNPRLVPDRVAAVHPPGIGYARIKDVNPPYELAFAWRFDVINPAVGAFREIAETVTLRGAPTLSSRDCTCAPRRCSPLRSERLRQEICC